MLAHHLQCWPNIKQTLGSLHTIKTHLHTQIWPQMVVVQKKEKIL